MIGMAQIMTPAGVRELPLYIDQRDLVSDIEAGKIQFNQEIVYRNMICIVLNDFTDEDGCRYAELVVVDGTGVSFANMNPMGDGFQRVEFQMQ